MDGAERGHRCGSCTGDALDKGLDPATRTHAHTLSRHDRNRFQMSLSLFPLFLSCRDREIMTKTLEIMNEDI